MTLTGTAPTQRERSIKCLVWDLDYTLWEGTLLEGGEVVPRPESVRVIKELDAVGVLQSIASKNDWELAMEQLRKCGLANYFLYPHIGWQPKSASVRSIAENLNIGLDAVAFVDDQQFELDEVGFNVPEVRLVGADDVPGLTERPEFSPRFVPLRADLAVNQNYGWADEDPLEVPLTAFGASSGEQAWNGHARSWASHTQSTFKTVDFTGHHFSIVEQPRILFTELAKDVSEWP